MQRAQIELLAKRVLGSREEAQRWLERPALALDGRKPSELLDTRQGRDAVRHLLGRIEHGVYT